MNRSILFIILSVVFLASCKTSKKVETVGAVTPTETIQPDTVIVVTPPAEDSNDFTARIYVSVDLNGKSFATKGHLRMRKNDVIQISLLDPFLNISEVGRLEISADNVMLINRINNEYVIATYDEINGMAHINPPLSFAIIQEHFWRESMRTDTDSFSFSVSGINIDLRLSDRNSSSKWEAHTQPSSRYQKVSVQQLFSSLIQ